MLVGAGGNSISSCTGTKGFALQHIGGNSKAYVFCHPLFDVNYSAMLMLVLISNAMLGNCIGFRGVNP